MFEKIMKNVIMLLRILMTIICFATCFKFYRAGLGNMGSVYGVFGVLFLSDVIDNK